MDWLYCVGFIEYIVDPSFHVMNDAIAALTASLQKQCNHGNQHAPAGDDVIVDVTSSHAAAAVSEPSPPPTPPSVGRSFVLFVLPTPAKVRVISCVCDCARVCLCVRPCSE